MRLIKYMFLVSWVGDKLYSMELGKYFSIVNRCVPYEDTIILWEDSLDHNFLVENKIILGSDLNFIMKIFEIWGNYTREDPFIDLFLTQIRGSMASGCGVNQIDPSLEKYEDRTSEEFQKA